MDPTSSRKTILVVDDAPSLALVLSERLKDEFRVEVVTSGPEALARMEKPDLPDLILLDIMMPGMDGYEVCRRLKADPRTAEIPVIFLTALTETSDEAQAMQVGASDFITKPFNVARIRLRVRNHLRLREVMEEVRRQARKLEKANQELLRDHLELKLLNQKKSEFLGIAVHDLKNPLIAIAGLAELLIEAERESVRIALSPEKKIKMLGAVADSANHLRLILKDLLANEELDSGRVDLNCAPEDLAELTRAVCDLNRAQAEKKQLQLFLDIRDDCVANVDGRRMREVMDNLLSNAIKYSPPGKRVWVRLAPGAGQPPTVCFAVRDEGPGFTPEDQQRLFARFVKLSARPTGGESSTGLGLSIVKRLVDLHGGRILVDTAVGQGSTFAVEVPV